MENLKLVKKDDRCFVNPLLHSSVSQNPLTDEFEKKVHVFATNLFRQWEKKIKKEIEYTRAWEKYSVYTGIGGYALFYLQLGISQKEVDFVEQGFFLAEKCTMHLHGEKKSFLTGHGGPLAIAAVAAHITKQTEKAEHFINKLEKLYNSPEVLESPDTPDELLYGRAGCLYALLYIKQNGGKVNEEVISSLAHAIVQSGRKLSEELRKKDPFTPPLMYEWHGKKYLAAAHGMAGILYMLLQVKDHLNQTILEDCIKPTLDYMMSVRLPSGNYPSSLGNGSDRLVQWCHGTPGFIHCFVKASQVFQSSVYLDAAVKCSDVIWERGLLTKGFGLCHGMAGNAYGFLHLYQVSGDLVHLHRACQFTHIILEAPPHECRTPDHPYSMFEGSAGTIHFLFDLLNPVASCFPGYQINL